MAKYLAGVVAMTVAVLCGYVSGRADDRNVERLAASPTAIVPTPHKSPGIAPLLPPEGLPTAPPPDAIKPVEPRAVQPAPDPASAAGRAPAVGILHSVSGGV
jgi:hypothetical protein